MKKLNLLQGTKEWLEIRLSHLTASEAPAMMNASKYLSRNELLDLKKSGVAKPVNEHTQKLFDKGHEAEDLARNIIELELFENLPPLVGTFEFKGLPLLASFDGISEDNSLIWEHKLTNQTLVENVKNGLLEPHYYWQLEHQLLVSGAEKAMFTCSDGTEENMVSMTYASVPERRQQLVAGWKQFAKDLSKHEVKAKTEKVVATEVDTFPLVTFEVTGTQISSNINNVLVTIKERITHELSKTLETDQDFADAKALVKQVKKARENLKALQQNVQDQFVSYRDFSVVAKEIDSVLQKFGASRDKEVKAAEQAKKTAIITMANTELSQLLFALQTEFNGVAVIVNNDFNSVIKNKRTIESIQNAVDSELARCKIIANEQATKIRAEQHKTVEDELKEITEHELCCSNEFTRTEPLQPLPLSKATKNITSAYDDIVNYFVEQHVLNIDIAEKIARSLINDCVPHVLVNTTIAS